MTLKSGVQCQCKPGSQHGNDHGPKSKSSHWMLGLTGESPRITKNSSPNPKHPLESCPLVIYSLVWLILTDSFCLNKKPRWLQWKNALFSFGTRDEGWGRIHTTSNSAVPKFLRITWIPWPTPRFWFSKSEVESGIYIFLTNPWPNGFNGSSDHNMEELDKDVPPKIPRTLEPDIK